MRRGDPGAPHLVKLTRIMTRCLKKPFTFSGRAGRREFWQCALAWGSVFMIWRGIAAYSATVIFPSLKATLSMIASTVAMLLLVIGIVPLVCAGVRRLHDTGHSGRALGLAALFYAVGGFLFYSVFFSLGIDPWTVLTPMQEWMLSGFMIACFAPSVLALSYALWWLIRPSHPGANNYGPNPNEVMP